MNYTDNIQKLIRWHLINSGTFKNYMLVVDLEWRSFCKEEWKRDVWQSKNRQWKGTNISTRLLIFRSFWIGSAHAEERSETTEKTFATFITLSLGSECNFSYSNYYPLFPKYFCFFFSFILSFFMYPCPIDPCLVPFHPCLHVCWSPSKKFRGFCQCNKP